MVRWMCFPRSPRATLLALSIVAGFEGVTAQTDSATHDLPNNDMLPQTRELTTK